MERALSVDERIRRAEEIYQRRKQEGAREYATVNVADASEQNGSRIKKMLLQIAICLVIYFIYYLIQNSNYIFSESVINKTKDILSYNINLNTYYEYFNNLLTPENKENDITANAVEENGEIENILEEQNGIGGSFNELAIEEPLVVDTSTLSQMELDALDIKNRVSIILPLTGVVTSRFGLRSPTTPSVPKDHTGLDIATNTGTVILSAMDGTVMLVSSEGDYGNHIKIINGDIMTVYAHCKTIYVKEGQEIKQGEQIAEVGNTGNTTRTTFAFWD